MRVKSQKLRFESRRRARSADRSGVLLLIVLSMLVLFMLIGTAFMMSAGQEKTNATNSAKANSRGNNGTKLLDRALFQILRDTDNPFSAIRFHSLLRDQYGTQGFQGVIYRPTTVDLVNVVPPVGPVGQVTRFAGATAGTVPQQLGPTAGQFIDVYVRQLAWDLTPNPPNTPASLNDPLTPNPIDESSGPHKLATPDARHIIKLDRDVQNLPQLQPMPLTRGYYNGCLFTITSGPAGGQTTRILDYEYVGDIDPKNTTGTPPAYTRLFRFRVMAFARSDGQPLQIGTTDNPPKRVPELVDLADASFIVNGRAFGGTGVGYNPLAAQAQAKTSTLELFPYPGGYVGAELALLPNSVYFSPQIPAASAPLFIASRGGPSSLFDPFAAATPLATFSLINNPDPNPANAFYNYPTYAGPGDVNESYDAPDYNNMFLVLQTVTPRAQGRVVVPDDSYGNSDADNLPDVISAVHKDFKPADFMRLDLTDLPLPSFHRPDLMNFWFHRMVNSQWLTKEISDADERVTAVLQPYDPTTGAPRNGLGTAEAALITAIKRQASLRPLREDNPNFDGSNSQSIAGAIRGGMNSLGTGLLNGPPGAAQITTPFWEAVGPWDVDNDNDGVPDSIWVDIGNPIIEAEDGTRYKALVAVMVQDLDGRLNVNAHGLADQIVPTLDDPTRASFFDPTYGTRGWPIAAGNLAHNTASTNPKEVATSLQLPRGIGYGPAEISLRPLFPAPIVDKPAIESANRVDVLGPVDDFATVLFGRVRENNSLIYGRYGFSPVASLTNPALNYPHLPTGDRAAANSNYRFQADRNYATGETAAPSVAAQIKFFDYPWPSWNRIASIYQLYPPSSFGTPPDLKGRYALGVDYGGQLIQEVAYDVNPNTAALAPAQRLPFNLLAKSPYEIDLSSTQRRDEWATRGTPLSNTTSIFNTSLSQGDDAPFSTSDLEKVLRAWDQDSGTLPSRLWDNVSAFDPLKLMQFDPVRISNASQTAFNSTNTNELLATAQQVASINRRLVTTDSYSLPVLTSDFAERLKFGADGKPGKPGVDDDGGTSDPAKIDDSYLESILYTGAFVPATGVDDYLYVMGANPPATATITDYLRYRIVLELRKAGVTTPATDPTVENRVSLITQQVLAPELLAGQPMDLNRPFGDGQDNNNFVSKLADGVVDDPLEAGDPFLDVSGNGKWDNGEPFIDIDGSGGYTPPVDTGLWNALVAEQMSFDYTNGVSTPLHPAAQTAAETAIGKPIIGGIHNLESQGRQLFARHLYCLMLLLVDEHYIAPWDENDSQVLNWMDIKKKEIIPILTAAPYNLPPDQAAAQADFIVKRKNTCRQIAQWAINCADVRDSDVIMTPFEYDENPWDGWGTMGRDQNQIPLDGDPSTDENGDVANNKTAVLNWGTIFTTSVRSTMDVPAPATPIGQTRGVVWGAEKPDLLITETLAFHDRRAEDNEDPSGHTQMNSSSAAMPPRYKDDDLDQGLRPRGSAFVEIFNTNSAGGQHPAELYSKVDSSVPVTNPNRLLTSDGVEMGRLSNYAWDETKKRLTLEQSATNPSSNVNIIRSPVWRLIVVDEWPDSRNDDDTDDNPLDIAALPPTAQPQAYRDMKATVNNWVPSATSPNPPFRPTDPDFDAAFNAGYVPTQALPNQTRTTGTACIRFNLQYPYIEREFYFTTDHSSTLPPTPANPTDKDWDLTFGTFKLRVPYRGVQITYNPAGYSGEGQTQRFITAELETPGGTGSPISPIKPGRYGVIGSAGARHDQTKQVYTTAIGRTEVPGNFNTSDTMFVPEHTRRIELRPLPPTPPNVEQQQQVLVAGNGGDPKDEHQPAFAGAPPQFDPTTPPLGRDNEVIAYNGTYYNIQDAAGGTAPLTGDGIPDPIQEFYQPAVAIPVDGMNISEPAWGWAGREIDAAIEESEINKANGRSMTPQLKRFQKTAANKWEGRYVLTSGAGGDAFYDKPLDGWPSRTDSPSRPAYPIRPETLRTGTTANYRMVHLQRLANPLLPWNPPPGQFKDKAGNEMYRSNMPINPYRTVDSSSANLTAFNGVSEAEANYPFAKAAQGELRQYRPWPLTGTELNQYLAFFQTDKQIFSFRSQERGFWNRLTQIRTTTAPVPNPLVVPPQRMLWSQEPPMVRLKTARGAAGDLFGMIPSRQMTMRADEVPRPVKDAQDINPRNIPNRVDMVMEHTLGFGNKSWGLLYDKKGAKQPGFPPAKGPVSASTTSSAAPFPAAAGNPAPDKVRWDTDIATEYADTDEVSVDSTYPWLAWNNRPFVCAEELLSVPALSQSTMLRQYTAMDPTRPLNGYGLAKLATAAIPVSATAPQLPPTTAKTANEARWAAIQAPFGALANMVAATTLSITVQYNSTPITLGLTQGAADVLRNPTSGLPVLEPAYPDAKASIVPYGAPNFNRILDFVQVPSRYVGTDTMLNAETFNDVPTYVTTTEPFGSDISTPDDPRYKFQPPFNKVSRQRDPGRINLNTITSRRTEQVDSTGFWATPPTIWSEVFDGLMQRTRDANPSANQLSQFGPAWRDVVLSRRGYAEIELDPTTIIESVDKLPATKNPKQFADVHEAGLNKFFPTMFANPFRAADAGDLVPVQQMMQYGVDASLERVHPWRRGIDGIWGDAATQFFGDARDAGQGSNDTLSVRTSPTTTPPLVPPIGGNGTPAIAPIAIWTIPNDDINGRDMLPLFSERRSQPFADTDRNPYMMYEPMSRLRNLVTNRSGVFAVWITVGYFEVERAPDWNSNENGVKERCGNDIALYNRIYPDGYMLGREVGSDTGDTKRPRGFYIIDRTEEVGFKPGEDLNVEKMIRLRRRIE